MDDISTNDTADRSSLDEEILNILLAYRARQVRVVELTATDITLPHATVAASSTASIPTSESTAMWYRAREWVGVRGAHGDKQNLDKFSYEIPVQERVHGILGPFVRRVPP